MSLVSQLYLMTGTFTVLIALLAVLLWRKSGSIDYLFGAAALYFWSIHGAWGFVYDKTRDTTLFRYHYLEEALFEVSIDAYFAQSLTLYGIFCTTVLLTAFLLCNGRRAQGLPVVERVPINHDVVILSSVVAGLLGYALIANVFVEAVVLGQSGYQAVATQSIPYFTVHQLLGRYALFAALIGVCIWLTGRRNRFFRADLRARHIMLYPLLLLVLLAYMMLLGNKNELFTGFVLAGLFYVRCLERPPMAAMAALAVGLLAVVGSVDYLRNFAVLSGELAEVEASELAAETAKIVFSNEAFAAHMSMYGAISLDMQPSFGQGILALLLSVVPSFVWPDRPVGNYEYYATLVGAEEGRGYTIHHATSWFLDFGTPGVIIGGVLLGVIWSFLENRAADIRPGRSVGYVIGFAVVAAAFSAYFPAIIRAGVEVYKGVTYGAVLIPVGAIVVAYVAACWTQPAVRPVADTR